MLLRRHAANMVRRARKATWRMPKPHKNPSTERNGFAIVAYIWTSRR
jgi:hypothetical protein